jgi:plasmid stabilization system protein ParE
LYEVAWTDEAVGHLEAIVGYVAALNPAAAERLGQRLVALANSLETYPNRGRDAGEGRQDISVVWPYIMRYRVVGETVLILRIRHGARDEEE